jgi:hypothetical protein
MDMNVSIVLFPLHGALLTADLGLESLPGGVQVNDRM